MNKSVEKNTMKIIKKACFTAMAASGIALLVSGPALAETSPSAGSMSEVKSIRVESAACPTAISEELSKRGFLVNKSGPSDAVLQVEVKKSGAISSAGRPLPVYSAKLRGQDQKLLFMAAGDKEAVNPEQLCKGIADDIADRLGAA